MTRETQRIITRMSLTEINALLAGAATADPAVLREARRRLEQLKGLIAVSIDGIDGRGDRGLIERLEERAA